MKICTSLIAVALLSSCASCACGQATPPWSKGGNNPAVNKGYAFQVDTIDNVPDLHGNPQDAKLVLFIGGNQFFVLPRLIAGFEKLHPELASHIFYETLPPGILRKQIAEGNTLTLGNLTLQVQPDVYEAEESALSDMEKSGQTGKTVLYATNDLAIIVPRDNPRHIHSLNDLGNPSVSLSMPNPAWEGVGKQIGNSLRKAGGDALYQSVYVDKVKTGRTYLTSIHHRQTPMRIMQGQSDAGVVWSSEVIFQKKIGNPIAGIAIPSSQNTTAVYAAGILRNAPHADAAQAWVSYLLSAEAQSAYKEFGFGSYSGSQEK